MNRPVGWPEWFSSPETGHGRLDRRRTRYGLLGAYVAVATALGGLTYHSVDPGIHLAGAHSVVAGTPLYDYGRLTYPPLYYWILGIVTFPTDPTTTTYGTLALVTLPSATSIAVAAEVGYRTVDPERRTTMFAFCLCNPVFVLTGIVWNQADAVVLPWVVLALVAYGAGRYRTFAFAAALGGALKVYPAVMLLPVALRHRDRWRDLAIGAALPVSLTLALLAYHAPGSVHAFFDRSHGFGLRSTPVDNPFAIATTVVSYWVVEPVANAANLLGTLTAATWAWWADVDPPELRPAAPLLVAVFTYPTYFPYRWVGPLVALAWIGYRAEPATGRFRDAAYVVTLIGTMYYYRYLDGVTFTFRRGTLSVPSIPASGVRFWQLVGGAMLVTVLWAVVRGTAGRPTTE